MTDLFTAFTGFLANFKSGVSANVLAKVPAATVYPLASVVLALVAIVGATRGGLNIEYWLRSVSTWTEVIVLGLAVVGFAMLAFLLWVFQPVVSALFAGDWWGRIVKVTGLQSRHQAEWGNRHRHYEDTRALWSLLDEAARQASVLVATGPLAVGATLTAEDVQLDTVADVPDDALRAPDQVVGRTLTRPLAAGAVLTKDALLPDETSIWRTGTQDISLVLPATAVPADLGPGDLATVWFQQASPATAVTIDPAGWLVEAMQPMSPSGTSGPPQVTLQLAVPWEQVGTLLSKPPNSLTVVGRSRPDPPPLWGDAIRLRRWVPVQGLQYVPSKPQGEQPKPGDLYNLKWVQDGDPSDKEPLEKAAFLESINDSWVLAIRAEDLAKVKRAQSLSPVRTEVSRSTVRVPALREDLAKGQLTPSTETKLIHALVCADKGPSGHVVAGLFKPDREIYPIDVVSDRKALLGRLAMDQLDANKPVLTVKLGPPGERKTLLEDLPCATDQVLQGVTPPSVVLFTLETKEEKPTKAKGLPRVGIGVLTGSALKDKVTHVTIQAIGDWPKTSSWYVAELRKIDDVAAVPTLVEHLQKCCTPTCTEPLLEKIRCPSREDDALNAVNGLAKVALQAVELRQWFEQSNTADADKRQQWRHQLAYALTQLPLRDAQRVVEDRMDERHRFFRLYYPSHESMVAPTAIGNILRSVDSYVEDAFGMDAAVVLPRLQTLLAAQPDGTDLSNPQNQLAMMEWFVLGAGAIGLAGTAIAFFTPHHEGLPLVVWLASSVAGFVAYRGAVAAAFGYAGQLRSMFDQRRGQLLASFGIKLPATLTARVERAIWRDLGGWLEYGWSCENRQYILPTSVSSGPASTATANKPSDGDGKKGAAS